MAIIGVSATILYVFTDHELYILGELVGEAMSEEDFKDSWDQEDREVIAQLRLKLTPEAQSEIHELESRIRATPTEGAEVDRAADE